MKLNIISTVLVLSCSLANAQQWTGNNTTDPTTRTGNVGIGAPVPAAKLSFNNVDDGSNGPDGITWHNPSPLEYGIYRTAGSWTAPDYQQLRINFVTGILLDPGTAYGKSYVDVRGNGLRVTSGLVGIGTIAPSAKLQVISSTNSSADNTMRLEAPAIGPIVSHIHHGSTGDWYIRSASTSGKVVIQDYDGALVGIGTDTPNGKLNIYSQSAFNSNEAAIGQDHIILRANDPGNGGYFGGLTWESGGRRRASIVATRENDDADYVGIAFFTQGVDGPGPIYESMRITRYGNVGIGTSAPDAKLAVKGDIHAREVRVDMAGAVAGDYVFEKDYELISLPELEKYILKNKHLPEIPSAKQMDEAGLNLKEMNLLLLKKVEELTLHLIAMNKRVEALEHKNGR